MKEAGLNCRLRTVNRRRDMPGGEQISPGSAGNSPVGASNVRAGSADFSAVFFFFFYPGSQTGADNVPSLAA